MATTNYGLAKFASTDNGDLVAINTALDSVDSLTQTIDSRWLTTGEAIYPRSGETSTSVTLPSGTLRLIYFTAIKSEAITQVKTITGGTAAAATPTLCKVGIYTVAGNGDLTLASGMTSSTSMWNAASTAFTATLTSTVTTVRGTRYALGLIVVSGAATPTFLGQTGGSNASSGIAPRIAATLAAQTDLPSTITDASVSASSSIIQAHLLP